MIHKKQDHNVDNEIFSISSYILYLVLPKCVITYGEVFSTIYFHIATNISTSQHIKNQFKNSCWLNISTIAKNTQYNKRLIYKTIKLLEDLELIHVVSIGKVKTYRLINHNLVEENDIWGFIHKVENTIFSSLEKKEEIKIRDKFKELNQLSLSRINNVSYVYYLQEINQIKNKIIEIEKSYKGSSLFYIHLLVESIFFNKTPINEQQRSIFIGSSQPTLNRYIKSYEKSKIITRSRLSKTYSLNLFEIEQIDKKINTNIEKKVVDKMEEVFSCPICNVNFNTPKSLTMHLTKTKDENHQGLIKIKKDNNFDIPQLLEYVSVTTTKKDNKKTKKPIDQYLQIPCPCSITCKDCQENWKEDYFDSCQLKRKQAYIKEYGLETKSVSNNKKDTTKGGEVDFVDLPIQKEENSATLVNYFYKLTGGKSYNFAKEATQIKNALNNKNLELNIDMMKKVLDFMFMKGQENLKFLTTSITDYKTHSKYLGQLKEEGTAPFLLQRYYDGVKLPLNTQNFTKEVAKVKYSIDCDGYENTKIIIDYMVKKNCTNINFIGNMRNEALMNKNKIAQQEVKISSFKENPSFFDQDDLIFIRDEIKGARTKISKIDIKYREKVIDMAKRLLIEKTFNPNYSSFEWAWRIGLELDTETYNVACKDIDNKFFNYAFKNVQGEEKIEMLNRNKKLFDEWLEKQHEIFGQYQQKI